MLQLHVADHQEADAAWRMLNAVPDELFQPVALHVGGQPLHVIIRDAEGDQTTAPL